MERRCGVAKHSIHDRTLNQISKFYSKPVDFKSYVCFSELTPQYICLRVTTLCSSHKQPHSIYFHLALPLIWHASFPDVDTSVAGEQVRAFRCCFGQGFIAASSNTLLRSQIHKHQIPSNEKLLKCLKVVLWVLLPLHCEISFSSVHTFLSFVGYSF